MNEQGVARLEASVLNPGEYVVSATMKANDVYLGQVRVGVVSENAWRYTDGHSVDPVLWYDRDKSKFFVKYEMPASAPYQVTEDGMAVRAYNKPIGWRPAGVGDLNGDGHIDLVWQSEQTGAVLVWYMREGALVDRMRYLSKGTPWRLTQVRDQDGDGDPDLYFSRNGTTKAAIWHNDDGWFNRVTMKETLMEMPQLKPAYLTVSSI